ncbi:hypothetical protein DSM112329_04720 [Paraconexibacter sp. AEG42_29]|uniref:Uncharacterized protein n=1 Tax=Paraconexibacter sp. AEG42_29 TaxID=2997339 RepID=A0AAU7B1M9_9ACTN
MDHRPDPLRAYADAVRAGDNTLAALIAHRVFRRSHTRDPDAAAPPSQAARDTLRRLRDHLGI